MARPLKCRRLEMLDAHDCSVVAAVALSVVLLSDSSQAEPTPLLVATDDASPQVASPQADEVVETEEAVPDAFLPGEGHVALSLGGGIPFAVVGEIGVGLSDGFAIGVVAGAADTMDEAAVGGRMRIGVFMREHVDVAIALPVLYYPKSDKRSGEDWLLSNPALLVRGRPGAGVGIYGGAGALVTSCVDSFAAAFGAEPDHQASDSHASEHDAEGEPTEMVDGAWNTFHFGGTVHVTAGFSAFLDTMLVARGIVPAESYGERVGPPFLAIAGGSYVF